MKFSGSKGIYNTLIKRMLDILFSAVCIILLSPLLLIIALLILADDGLPIVYTQERIGRDLCPFRIYKFRTMVKNADKIGPAYTKSKDPRILKTGRFLRSTSCDELLQLLNVLKGDMSIVGFRPGVLQNYQDVDKTAPLFTVRPGITGYAQINGRSNLSLSDKRRWENKYAEDVSFGMDVKIFLRTFIVVFSKANTN